MEVKKDTLVGGSFIDDEQRKSRGSTKNLILKQQSSRKSNAALLPVLPDWVPCLKELPGSATLDEEWQVNTKARKAFSNPIPARSQMEGEKSDWKKSKNEATPFNKARTLSRQLSPHQWNRVRTLTGLIDTNYDADFKATPSVSAHSVKGPGENEHQWLQVLGGDASRDSEIEASDVEGTTGILSIYSDDDRSKAQQELYDLVNDHDRLAAENEWYQKRTIQLENDLEELHENMRGKRLVTEHSMSNRLSLAERLDRVVELEAHNRMLALEVNHLREALEEMEEMHNNNLPSTDTLRTPYKNTRKLSTQLLTDFVKQVNIDDDKHLQLESLDIENQDLRRIIQQKNKEIEKLELEMNLRAEGFFMIEQELQSKERRITTVEVEVEKVDQKLLVATEERDALKHRASILANQVEDKSSELRQMEERLAAEKEAVRIAGIEKERLAAQLEEMGIEKVRQDKTFMNLFDEMFENSAEEAADEQKLVSQQYDDLVVFQQPGLETAVSYVETDMERYSEPVKTPQSPRYEQLRKKSKPDYPPPARPKLASTGRQSSRVGNFKKTRALSPKEQEDRMTKAAEEFFLMTTISVRMNLAEYYKNEDIMTADTKMLWEMCKKLQVPMNKFYLYIEECIRTEFNLPGLAYRLKEPKKSIYNKPGAKCSIM